MSQEEKPNVNESQQVSQPAGEARGEGLPPQGQGGPHLPDISEPTSRSLSEQFESGPDPVEPAKGSEVEQPAEEPHGTEVLTTDLPHKCFVCNGPDHRACGCEAKERKRQIKQDDESFRSQDIVNEELAESRIDQELDREDANADEVLGKEAEERLVKMAGEMSGALMQGVDRFEEFKSGVLDGLRDINSNLEILVKLEKDRADLLKDIKNVGANPN